MKYYKIMAIHFCKRDVNASVAQYTYIYKGSKSNYKPLCEIRQPPVKK